MILENGIIYYPSNPAEVTHYVPVEPSDISHPNLVHFPATRVFSLLAYGDYSIINNMCSIFWNEVKKRNIHPIGSARFMGLVAPYVGRDISPEDFCYRLVFPVEG